MEGLDGDSIWLKFNDTKLTRLILWNTNRCDCYRCLVLLMEIEHLLWIHTVNVVGTKDENVIRIFIVDEIEVLQDGIGASGVPTWSEALLCRNRCHKVVGER